MLIVLPPSETQAWPESGAGLDLAGLSFPELTSARGQVLDAMVRTSRLPDAVRRLDAPAGAAAEVARNVGVWTAPTVAAGRLYRGVLYAAFDPATLAREAARRVVIVSSLFGALRLSDRVPAYRLGICARLDGLEAPGLEAFWRGRLGPVLTDAAGDGVVVDLRSSSYTPVWRPGPELAGRWVLLRVPGSPHAAKAARGRVARLLSEEPEEPRDVTEVAAVVGAAFDVELHAPARARAPWMLDVRAVAPVR
ncbi:YaaA family protein [Jiangella anatolica]|uniref:YaaA family protein n=1 Tax=Jiangella anatolica TaxID=2670374 RepID=UPI001315029B|nr:peroxide stress protein YaaA [Jiangella anatolica]